MVDRADQSKSRLFSLEAGTLKIVESEIIVDESTIHRAGSLVDAKYKIVRLVGEGGMGVVYIAHHAMLDKDVALKTFRSKNLSSDSLIRFQREAQAIAKLNHQHVVQVFDFGQSQEGLPYYTMELLSGKTLADKLHGQGALQPAAAVQIFKQVCLGLAAAHSKGIVHRDLKPANICLEPLSTKNGGETVKIVDFGIASLAGLSETQRLTTSGIIFGSPLYMSPEQAVGQNVTAQSDIYSLGCTLFEALTGQTPFRGATALETIMQHQASEPPSLRQASGGKHFSQQLEDIVARMLAKTPAERPATISEVGDALGKIDSFENPIARDAVKADHRRLQTELPQYDHSGKTPLSALKPKVFGAIMVGVIGVTAIIGLQTQHFKLQPPATSAPTSQVSDVKVARLRKTNRRRIFEGKKEFFVLELEPNVELGIFKGCNTDTKDIRAYGKFKWPTDSLVSFRPAADFWADLDNFEALPDNCLYGLNCEYVPKDVDRQRLLEIFSRQSKTLSVLYLIGIELKKSDLKALSRLPKLVALSVADTDLDGVEITKLPQLSNFTSLDFSADKNASAIIKALESSQKIKQLWFTSTNLNSEDIKKIATMSKLERLGIGNNPKLTDDDLKSLLKLKNLSELRVDGCSLSPAAIATLAAMKKLNLTELVTSRNKWSDKDVERLKQIYPSCDVKDGWTSDRQNNALSGLGDFYYFSKDEKSPAARN